MAHAVQHRPGPPPPGLRRFRGRPRNRRPRARQVTARSRSAGLLGLQHEGAGGADEGDVGRIDLGRNGAGAAGVLRAETLTNGFRAGGFRRAPASKRAAKAQNNEPARKAAKGRRRAKPSRRRRWKTGKERGLWPPAVSRMGRPVVIWQRLTVLRAGAPTDDIGRGRLAAGGILANPVRSGRKQP